VDAEDLEIGDLVLALDGDYGVVEATLTDARTQTLYDLDVAIVDTFAVGDGAWVVHNTNLPDFCNVLGRINPNSDIVYRNPNFDELPRAESVGFRPKNPDANITVAGHIWGPTSNGTQYISTSRNIYWTGYYQGLNYQRHGVKNPFYVIDLQRTIGQIIDLTDPTVLNTHILPNDYRRLKFARQASEVLVEGNIPTNAIVARIDFDDDFVRYSTDLINRGRSEGWWSKGSNWYVP